jgi:orotate phosphoribosyltransferase
MSTIVHRDDELFRWVPCRKGHFRFESGHHGELWLELELLCLRPGPIAQLAGRLAARLSKYGVEVVCGPLVEGSFVSLLVSQQVSLPFCYSEPQAAGEDLALFPVKYRIPGGLRRELNGKRVAIVNDVINAGSAVRGTLDDLRACGARPVAIAALALLGPCAARLAADNSLPLETLYELPSSIWSPAECPLCANGIPLSSGPVGGT